MKYETRICVGRLFLSLALILGLAGPLAAPVAAAAYTLDATTCAASLGTWNAATSTCTVTGGRTLSDDWTVPAGTTLLIPVGAGVSVSGGTFTNQGTITALYPFQVSGGSMVNAGTITIGTAGQPMPEFNWWSFSFNFPMLVVSTATFTNAASGVINNHVFLMNIGTLNNNGTIQNRAYLQNNGTLANNGTVENLCGGLLDGTGSWTGNAPVTAVCQLDAGYCAAIPGAWNPGNSTCTVSAYNTMGRWAMTIPAGTTLKVEPGAGFMNAIAVLNEGTIVNEGNFALTASQSGYQSTFTNAVSGVVDNWGAMATTGSATNNGTMRNLCGGTFTGPIDGNPVIEACTLATACAPKLAGTWDAGSNTCTVSANPVYVMFDLTVRAGETIRILTTAALANMKALVNQGTITNEGSFAPSSGAFGGSTFTNHGVVNNLGMIGQDGGTVTNAGVLNIGTAAQPMAQYWVYSGTFSNATTGTVHVRGAIMNQATINNAGTVRVYCGGFINPVNGTWTGNAATEEPCLLDAALCASAFGGTWTAGTSTCTVSGARQLYGDVAIPAGVTLVIPAETSVMNNADLTNAGTIVNRGGLFLSLQWFESVSSSLMNLAGALIDNHTGMINAGAVTNHGVVQNRCGALYTNTFTMLPTSPFAPGVTLTGTWSGNAIVDACNVAPVANNDTYVATEDTTLTIGAAAGVLANDTDAEGNALTAIRVTNASHGNVTLNANGSFTYVPTANYCGADGFTYKANDGTDDSNVATVNIAVACVDDPPVAVNDSYTTLEGRPLIIANPGVLANDYDIDSSGLEATQMSSPAHGSLVLSNMGGFLFEPAANWCGTDSFTYRISSITGANRIGNTATVTLNVTCVNEAPMARPDSYTTSEDRTLNESAPGVLGNDSDPDGDPLTAQLRSNPSHGTVALNADGSFSYTPAPNYYGPDSFTYRVYDGRLYSADTTVSITVTPVNDEPVAVDDHYTVLERATLTVAAPGVLANDSDIEGSPLTAIKWDGPWRGSATLNADGSFTYTPWGVTCGLDYFVYRARDTGMAESNFATVFVDVTCVNDAPSLNPIGNKTVNELATLTFTASATDPDYGTTAPHTLTFSLVSPPSGATINGATGVFTWTPTEVQGAGSYPVTVKVCDNGALCDQQTITVTVNEVNSAPVLAAIGNKSVDEMVALTFSATATDPDTGTGAKNVLTYSLVGAPTGASINSVTGAFTWTPTEEQGPGSYTITFRVCDNGSPALCDEEAITVTVNEVNRAPVLTPVGNKTVDEETLLSFLATGYDLDLGTGAANALTFSISGAPEGASMTAGGAFAWTPTEAQGAGEYTFTVTVCDNGTPPFCDDEVITVTVNEVNRAPSVGDIAPQTVDEMTELALTVPGSDPDTGSGAANRLTFGFACPTQGATLTPAGAFAWTPTEAQGRGEYTFFVSVCDDGAPALCNTGSFNVTVNEVNREPVLDAIGDWTVDEMTELAFTATGSDPDTGTDAANNLTFTLADAPSGASITANGEFTWTPTEAQGAGTYKIWVLVWDDAGLSDFEIITITVKEVNRAPELGTIATPLNGPWGNTISFTATATDPDLNAGVANTLTFNLLDAPDGATIDGASGAFLWEPMAGQIGTHTLTVLVRDNGSPVLEDSQSVTITVDKRATILVYQGATSGQYSDAVAVYALLADDSSLPRQPLFNLPIAFTIGTQQTTAKTDSSGRAAGSIVLTQPAGERGVSAAFAGNDYYEPSSDSDTFTITNESAEIIYTGDTQVVTSKVGAKATVVLAATLTEDADGSLGTRLGEQTLRFEVFSFGDSGLVMAIASCQAPVTGVTAGTGSAACSVSLGAADPYQIRTTLLDNGYYAAPADVSLAQVSDPGSGISGGGWLLDPGGDGRVKFAFGAKFLKNGRIQGNSITMYRWTGDLSQLVAGVPAGERSYNMVIKSNALSSMVLLSEDATGAGSQGTLTGKCTLQAVDRETGILYSVAGGLLFQVDGVDNSKTGEPDGYALRVWDTSGVRYMTGDAYDGSGTLAATIAIGGGHIKVTIK